MIARTPEQQMLYNARLKFQRDEAAKLELATAKGWTEGQIQGRIEGRIEGRMEGERIGEIRLLERLLGQPQTPADELAKLPMDQLAARFEVLTRQLQDRKT